VVRFAFNLDQDYEAVAALMRRYADAPMSLADACLVRMSELHRDCQVFTTDQHFKIYRRFGRQVIPLICPS
jgi:predicted nucleic acid-binding protein